MEKYNRLIEMGIDQMKEQLVEPAFQEYLYQLTKKYSAKDIFRVGKVVFDVTAMVKKVKL